MGGHAAHRGDQAGFGAAPDLVVGLILADGIDQVVPFELVGVRLIVGGVAPNEVLLVQVLALEDSAPGRRMPPFRDDRRAFAAVRVAGELPVAAVDAPPFEHQLGAVCESVFHGIDIKVLVDVLAAVMPAAGSLGLHRPSIFHPAAFVDVVNQEVAVAAAAGPEE